MKQNYRIYGMAICLALIVTAGVFLVAVSNEMYHELAALITMFVGGYGLRETMDHFGENENATVKE